MKSITRSRITRAIQDDTEMLVEGSKTDNLRLPEINEAPAPTLFT